MIPGPCPLTSEQVENEAEGVMRDYPATDEYLGRIENYCDGVDAARFN